MTDGPAEGARKWLLNQGYPLEMRTARAFRTSGVAVTASDHYIDPETGKSREIDLIAFRHVVSDNNLALIIAAVIECKTVPPGKQWVGFDTGGFLPGRLIFHERVTSPLGEGWMGRQHERHDVPALDNTARHVHGLTTTYQDAPERDSAYQAVKGAVHAAVARAMEWTAAGQHHYDNRVAGVALPVVVVAGDLLVARLDEDDQMQLDPCENLIVTWREPIAGRSITLVNVVTEAALPGFARDFAATATTLTDQTQPQAQSALADEAGQRPDAVVTAPKGRMR